MWDFLTKSFFLRSKAYVLWSNAHSTTNQSQIFQEGLNSWHFDLKIKLLKSFWGKRWRRRRCGSWQRSKGKDLKGFRKCGASARKIVLVFHADKIFFICVKGISPSVKSRKLRRFFACILKGFCKFLNGIFLFSKLQDLHILVGISPWISIKLWIYWHFLHSVIKFSLWLFEILNPEMSWNQQASMSPRKPKMQQQSWEGTPTINLYEPNREFYDSSPNVPLASISSPAKKSPTNQSRKVNYNKYCLPNPKHQISDPGTYYNNVATTALRSPKSSMEKNFDFELSNQTRSPLKSSGSNRRYYEETSTSDSAPATLTSQRKYEFGAVSPKFDKSMCDEWPELPLLIEVKTVKIHPKVYSRNWSQSGDISIWWPQNLQTWKFVHHRQFRNISDIENHLIFSKPSEVATLNKKWKKNSVLFSRWTWKMSKFIVYA